MKPNIVPILDFLNAYDVPPDLTKRALEFAGVVIDRSRDRFWGLDPIEKIDPQAALRTFNDCFHRQIGKVEILSLEALEASPVAIIAILSSLIPVDVELCVEALGTDFEARTAGLMETRINEAISRSLDPDGDLQGPPITLLKNIPPAFVDGLALSSIMSFMAVVVAALGDDKLLDHISPFIRLTHRCLILGCSDASRETLLILAA